MQLKAATTYSALTTDMYELTMLAGYLEQGCAEQPAGFDLFYRRKVRWYFRMQRL